MTTKFEIDALIEGVAVDVLKSLGALMTTKFELNALMLLWGFPRNCSKGICQSPYLVAVSK